MAALSAAILILAVAAPAQQMPAEGATTAAGSPCVRSASRTDRSKADVCPPAGRQDATSKDAKAANLRLIGIAPVNPMALAKTIRPPATKSSPKVGDGAHSSVTEFQVVSGSTQEDATAARKSKRKFLKDVHGEAYGALAPGLDGGHAAGAAVGASSKSGKTHVFIETDHSRDSSSR